MPDAIPPVELGLTDAGRPVVMLGTRGAEATDMADLLRLLPGLASPALAAELARAVNHLAHSSEFAVITDPAAFEAAYRARLAAEDPATSWREGAVRLHDFGIPDFSTIQPPSYQHGRLVFYAVDTYLGVPYRVEMTDLTLAPAYTPLPLTPVATPPDPAPDPEIVPISAEERGAWATHMPGD